MAYYSGFKASNHQIILKKINQLISTCTYVYTLYCTSHMPLTRYPKKKPEEQMRNCCHLGLCERQIPNKLRAFALLRLTSLLLLLWSLHSPKTKIQSKRVCKCGLWFPIIRDRQKCTYSKE